MKIMAFQSAQSIQSAQRLNRPNTKQNFMASPIRQIRQTPNCDTISFGKKVIIDLKTKEITIELEPFDAEALVDADVLIAKGAKIRTATIEGHADLDDHSIVEKLTAGSLKVAKSEITTAIVTGKAGLDKGTVGNLNAGSLLALNSTINTATIENHAHLLDSTKVGDLKAGSLNADNYEIATVTVTDKASLFNGTVKKLNAGSLFAWHSIIDAATIENKVHLSNTTVGKLHAGYLSALGGSKIGTATVAGDADLCDVKVTKLFAGGNVRLETIESVEELHMTGNATTRTLFISNISEVESTAEKMKIFLSDTIENFTIHTKMDVGGILERFGIATILRRFGITWGESNPSILERVDIAWEQGSKRSIEELASKIKVIQCLK